MRMNFTQHALDKLELYGLDPDDIATAARKPIYDLYDRKENSKIRIICIEGILIALVIAPETGNLITIYRTDQRTIDNRKEAEGGCYTSFWVYTFSGRSFQPAE